jgi:phenylacetate-CoA ligase
MHINCYGLFIETIEGSGGPSGQCGEIVATDLWNEGMPLIRYRIGDIGQLQYDKCLCGSELPRLASLLGRDADVFINSRNQRTPGVLTITKLYGALEEFSQLQLIQHDIGFFEALIVPGRCFEESSSVKELSRRLSEIMEEEVRLEARLVEKIPRERSGKTRFCRNLMINSE